MYNFLLSIRKLNLGVKIIIFIVVLLFCSVLVYGPLLFLAILLIYIVKSRETNPNKFSKEIDKLKNNYDKLREYVEGAENNVICFGSYVFEYEGKTCFFSKFLSIYVRNISDSIVNVYPCIERRRIENDVYFQFPIRKRYSKIAKITIILAVIQYINEKYPNDKIYLDKSVPIGVSAIGLNTIKNEFV